MIVELRRSAFDTDLILLEQNSQEPNARISLETVNDTINPRRVEALQRDYERLGFQVDLVSIEFCCSTLTNLESSRSNERFRNRTSRCFISSKSFLFLYS